MEKKTGINGAQAVYRVWQKTFETKANAVLFPTQCTVMKQHVVDTLPLQKYWNVSANFVIFTSLMDP